MAKNVTAKVAKSAGTDTPDNAANTVTRKGRTPVAPEQKTLTIRGAKRSNWSLLLAAFDGDPAAISRLFGNVPPAEPVAPILSDADRTDNAAVLAHVDALNAYAQAVRDYPAALDAYNVANTERSNLRNAVNAAILEIPLRKRNGADDDSAETAD